MEMGMEREGALGKAFGLFLVLEESLAITSRSHYGHVKERYDAY